MQQLILIAHNIRSCHNVGSLLRTSEGLGVLHVYLTGYTPYPLHAKDKRLPHLQTKITKQIQKTSLGAESMQAWTQIEDIFMLINSLRSKDCKVIALEQTATAIALTDAKAYDKVALVVGNERTGLENSVLAVVDETVEIPMRGKKESLNVVQAAAIALFHYSNAA